MESAGLSFNQSPRKVEAFENKSPGLPFKKPFLSEAKNNFQNLGKYFFRIAAIQLSGSRFP
jgi:hypothetical protein